MERTRLLKLLQALVVFMVVCKGVSGVSLCDATNTVVFPEIDPASYGQEYVDITSADSTTRPLGFMKFVLRYTLPPVTVCVSVQGATGRGVELMFETDPPAFLCFRDQTFETQCAQGTFYDCGYAKADTMVYEFHHNFAEGSSPSDINFWLRITKGVADDEDLGWCNDRDTKFPSSLPPPQPPPEPTVKGDPPVDTVGVLRDCGPGTSTEFIEIPKDQYEKKYVAIEDADNTTRPFGYMKGTVKFEATDGNPCVSVTGVLGTEVEVMFETVPPMVLCYRDQTGNEQCQEGRYQECKAAEADTMYYEFYCDASHAACNESDINFWYRITKGDAVDEDGEGMWCMQRDNKYPGDLLPPKPQDGPDSGSATLTSGVSLCLMCISFRFIGMSTMQ